jgi:hypothetical protein
MKKLELAVPKNANYTATVVALNNFVDLKNCDNVKAALIFGNSVIVSKSAQVGELGLFFPAETALSKEFLANNNLFRKTEYGNVDSEKTGFFEQHGRVKAVKFRGHKSEGFWIPIDSLSFTRIPLELFEPGMEFDILGDQKICRKYVSRVNRGTGTQKQQRKGPRLADMIVDNQFRFHFDTANLRRNIYRIEPDMYISISEKWHGTSAVFANIMVKSKLSLLKSFMRFLGVPIRDTEYGFTYSSRMVVKGVNGQSKEHAGFYDEDLWGTVAKEIEPLVPKGFTVYGEIVGYTPNGTQIQKGYHYGSQQGSHQFLVYRVTVTNADGQVVELSWPQMTEFCQKYGLNMVKELYYGKARDLFTMTDTEECDLQLNGWQEWFLQRLEDKFVNDQLCVYNNLEVPAEGIVIRIDRLNEAESYKLKNFRFLEHESEMLDKGEIDIEAAESEELTVSLDSTT